MTDDNRGTDPVRVRVIGRQFRSGGEEYLQGETLEVPEWQLDGYAGRIEAVDDPDSREEDDGGDGSDADESEDGGEVEVDPDPGDLTIDEIEARIADVDDPEMLAAIRAAEKAGKDRKGAKQAVDDRLTELEG